MDFVASRQNKKLYVQVAQRIDTKKTEKREYERLLEIRDNYPKYALRTDEFAGGNYEGIITMHVADFLLSEAYWPDPSLTPNAAVKQYNTKNSDIFCASERIWTTPYSRNQRVNALLEARF